MNFKPPKEIDFENPRWVEWKTSFETYRLITELAKKPEEIQVATLKYCMGIQSEEIIRTFELTEEQLKDYKLVLKRFEEYFKPRKNILRLRRIFHQRNQSDNEDEERYLRELYTLAEDCGFQNKKECIRDQFVAGICDENLAERLEHLYLSSENDFTLEKMMEHTRTYVDIKKSRNSKKKETEINRIHKKNYDKNKKTVDCSYCNNKHEQRQCPAYGKICNFCKKLNHFEIACYAKNKSGRGKENSIRMLTENNQTEYLSDEEASIAFLGQCSDKNNSINWSMNLTIENTENIKFKIDTGADVCIMNYDTFLSLKPVPNLLVSDKKLTCPAGSLSIRGMFNTSIKKSNEVASAKMYVLEQGNRTENLLSRDASVGLGIVKFVGNIEIDQELFGFGHWNTEPVKFSLMENTKPYAVTTARNIAIPLIEPVKEALKIMEKDKIIEKINHPTDWVSPMIPVRKENSKKVRICVDYKRLNQNLKREKYQIPTFDELSAKLNKSTVFTKLDASSGFFQIPIDEKSRDLTTFMTPNGRYRFLRLPMGVNIAPEIYQRKMTELIGDLSGVICYMDDIVVHGINQKEHDSNLNNVLQCIKISGIELNKDKCQFIKSKISFLGHIISSEGVTIDPSKVEAIKCLQAPSNIHELRRILGLCNYVQKFLPKAQEIMSPMNNLLQKNTPWFWGAYQQESFRKIKELVSEASTLAFYDPNLETTLSVDASSYGLGGVLLQYHNGKQRPIAYCSRSLTVHEKQWAQIEKECLAAVWGSEKFHIYLCGIQYNLHTDHKPLVSLINNKDLNESPVRCQRLLMRLARYSPIATYVPGKLLVVADTLSRDPSSQTLETELSDEVLLYVHNIIETLPATSPQIKRIEKLQNEDLILKTVVAYTLDGWPDSEVEYQYKKYFEARGSLSVINDNLLVYNNRIVMPKSLRNEMLQKIHDEGHMSLSKCRERVKMSMWWPQISTDLVNWISNCDFCQTNRRQQKAEPLKPSII